MAQGLKQCAWLLHSRGFRHDAVFHNMAKGLLAWHAIGQAGARRDGGTVDCLVAGRTCFKGFLNRKERPGE